MLPKNNETQDALFRRLAITFFIIFVLRIGTNLPVPSINHLELEFYIRNHSVAQNFVNIFSSNGTITISLFTLSIFPYINASILTQLLLVTPQLSKLQKEGDLEGKRTINRLTRLLTLIAAVFQSLSIATYLKQVLFEWNYYFAFEVVLYLTTGAMIILWLSEYITDYGLGNGASLFIYINILSNSNAIFQNIKAIPLLSLIILFICIGISIFGLIFLQDGFRRIPLVSSKQLNQLAWKKNSQNYLPLRFNQAGVMPIILTTALLVIPSYVINSGLIPELSFINFQFPRILYWIAYFSLIVIASLFYSEIVLNPKDVSEQLQKMSVTLPGIRPGTKTTFYLKRTMKRTSLLGGIALAVFVTFPNLIESQMDLAQIKGLTSTSVLIATGVVLDLIREINSIFFSNVYNDLYK